jgi:hypothetical protein
MPPSGANDIGGAGTLAQLFPPSRVRSTETVHVGHVAPRVQPVWSETKVTDAGLKPLGTGPPGGPAVEVGVGTVAVGDTVTVAVGEAVPTVDDAVGLRCGPAAGLEVHPVPSATAAAMTRIPTAFMTLIGGLPFLSSANRLTASGPPAGAAP